MIEEDGRQIAILAGWRDEGQIERARLMAAAPMLLAAARRAVCQMAVYDDMVEEYDALSAAIECATKGSGDALSPVPRRA